jgi:hypothetical protein
VLLRELKARGYKIVHVVEATPEQPKTPSLPEQWMARPEPPSYWPHVDVASLALAKPQLDAPNPHNFGLAEGTYLQSLPDRVRGGDREVPLPPVVLWPHGVKLVALSPPQTLPIPAAETFRYTRVWKPRSPMRSVRKPIVIPRKPPAATAAVAPKPQPAAAAPAAAMAKPLPAFLSRKPGPAAVSHKPPPPLASPKPPKAAMPLTPPTPTPAAAPVSSTAARNSEPVLRPPRSIGNETEPATSQQAGAQ